MSTKQLTESLFTKKLNKIITSTNNHNLLLYRLNKMLKDLKKEIPDMVVKKKRNGEGFILKFNKKKEDLSKD